MAVGVIDLDHFLRYVSPHLAVIVVKLAAGDDKADFTKNGVQIVDLSHQTGHVLVNLV